MREHTRASRRVYQWCSGDGEFVLTTRTANCASKLAIATGRAQHTRKLALDATGVTLTPAPSSSTPAAYKREHIYAAGDCTDQPQFVYGGSGSRRDRHDRR